MINQAQLDEASRTVLARGMKVLQGVRFGKTDEEHIAALLQAMNPQPSTHWLDIGCGFGEPARLMQELRPDLGFTLINNNAFQLNMVPDCFHKRLADMHDLPFRNATFDGAMFLFSLCHTPNKVDALAEAARVVRPGGRLFVFDYERLDGTDVRTAELLHSWFVRPQAFFTGWETLVFTYVAGDDQAFRELFENDQLYDELIGPLRPYFWKAMRI